MKLQNVAFGRKVKVTVYTNDGYSVIFESNHTDNKYGLRITGDIKKYFAIQPPEATISIYNLSNVEAAEIMNMKYKKVGNEFVEQQLRVRVEAGYEYGYFGTIFDGEILKPNMLKPDPNNTQLRLTCIDGANFVSAQGLTMTFNEGVNYYSVAEQIKNNTGVDYRLEMGEALKHRTVDGSFVIDGTLYDAMLAIGEETGTVFSFRDGTATLKTWNEMINASSEAYVLNKDTGLMGIPALTTDGLTVQSVMNPNYDVLKRIKMNNADISIDQPDYLTNRQIGAWLSSDGLYFIIELQHQFDTTTGSFCSNLKCVANNYFEKLGLYNSINGE